MIFGRARWLSEPPGDTPRDLAEGVLSRWLARGDAVLDELAGEFLLALWDSTRGRALLAVDRFSTYPLFWVSHGGRLGFSTAPAQAAEL
ncbi:MAG: hypothetical protein ACLGHY_06505, partial [Gammaproteobacteria bacterium]